MGRNLYLIFFLLSFCSLVNAKPMAAILNSKVPTPELLEIKSKVQKSISDSKMLFTGEVEVRLDATMHLYADAILFDKEHQKLYAKSCKNSYVKIETEDLLLLADHVIYDFTAKTIRVKQVKIHGSDGFIAAAYAYKKNDATWEIKDLLFTPCSEEIPHWSFTARKATLYKNYLVKVRGISFKVKGMRLLPLPLLRFSLRKGKTASGFLMPKVYFDQSKGVGLKTEYYWKLGPHADDTSSLFWRQYKGFVVSNEFRWALDPETYTILNGFYAQEWNATLEKNSKLVPGTAEHYWISGKYIQPFHGAQTSLRGLINLDIGTDKRFEYRFFSDSKTIEDNFLNAAILRWDNSHNIVETFVDQERTLRGKFSEGSSTLTTADDQTISFDKKEIQDRVTVTHAPQVSWSSAYLRMYDWLQYRHDLFVDYAMLQEELKQRYYEQDQLVYNSTPELFKEMGTFRFGYIGDFFHKISCKEQQFRISVKPHLHMRSHFKSGDYDPHLKQQSAHAFLEHVIAWDLPQYCYQHHLNNSFVCHQPSVAWSYVPNIWQKDWFYLDSRDRQFCKNRIDASWNLSLMQEFGSLHCLFNQGYEFAPQETFLLDRNPFQEHLLPFSIGIECNNDMWQLGLLQEYSWRKCTLIQSEAFLSCQYPKLACVGGYVYQHRHALDVRKFLSDIPHFLTLGVTVPLGKQLEFHYDGNFYAMGFDSLFGFKGMQPLLSSFAISYTSDCWGISFGSEEKRYRQSGIWHKEHSFVFRFKLDSLGSFAKKMRRSPDLIRIDS